MSYTTNADNARDNALVEIEAAIRNLSGIVVTRETSGHEEFSKVYKIQMTSALNKLLEARDLLNG